MILSILSEISELRRPGSVRGRSVGSNVSKQVLFSAGKGDRTCEYTVKGHICDLNLDISALVS